MRVPIEALGREDRRIILVATDAAYGQLVNAIDWSKVAKLMLAGGLMPGLAFPVLGRAVASST